MIEVFITVIIVLQLSLLAYLYGWYTGRMAMRQDFGLVEPEEMPDELNPEEVEE